MYQRSYLWNNNFDSTLIEEDCKVLVTLTDGREFNIVLEGDQVAYCNGWYYALLSELATLRYVVEEITAILQDSDRYDFIEDCDIESIYYEIHELYTNG